MRGLATLILCVLSAVAQTPCALHGTVVDRATGKALAMAHVFVTKTGETLVRTTGGRGEFCFEAVAPGRYQVTAQKVGFLDPLYKVVSVDAATKTPALKLEMVARAILAGIVVDLDGEPVSGAEVTVYRRKKEPDEIANQESDDRGRFRFADLPPGTYTVSVSLNGYVEDGRFRDEKGLPVNEKVPETFYPGGVKLEAGHDIDNLTLTLGKPERGPRRHLSGKVAPNVESARLRLEAIDVDGSPGFPIPVAPDGSFSRGGLETSRYALELSTDKEYARLEVDLTASDAEGLTIVPQPSGAIDIPLVTRTEGDGPPFRLTSSTRIFLHDWRTITFAEAAPDGSFTFHAVRPGLHGLSFQTGDEPYYIKQIRFGGGVVKADGIEVRSGGTGPIEVLLSPDVASIEGKVTGAAAGRVTVLLVAADGRRHTVADQQGKFTLDRLRPGRYRILAIEDFDDDDWRPELAAELKGAVVELAEGEHKQTEVPLVTSGEWSAALRK